MGKLDPRLENIFAQALTIADANERAAFVQGACGGDAALRREVETMLKADQGAGGFMNATRLVNPANAIPSEQSGDRIGRYKLLEQIGEGGFGVVWMAEQEVPVRRRVALKIIKLGMDTKEVVARFEAERQALAMMDHPHIASVFDGGATDTGRPYFVMELVKGIPITDYCDANKLSTRERLRLFMQVCQAVQHAHQKGVIHRDLKPSNILVTVKDDRPVPKVIDFGVAKATQARLTEKTLFTRFQQWIGTPAYMSPEQAGLGSLDVDTRSDIYSLGVLLYELLTGRPPFDTQKLLAAGYDAVMRTIREEEPPKPSTRLSTLAEEELTIVAAKRGAEPAKLGRLVRGDLDWIVMKALEKDRTRRYETAIAFARDIDASLKQEPVAAAAPSSAYRVRRFIARNQMAVGFSSALGLTLLVGSIVSTWQAWRASLATHEANRQRAVATNEAARSLRFADESAQARRQSEANAYASQILLAAQLWQNGDVENAEKNLDECATSLRGWEWNYLKRKFHSDLLTIPASQPAPDELELRFGLDHLVFIQDDTRLWVSRLLYERGYFEEPRSEGVFYNVTNGASVRVGTNLLPGVPSADGRRIVSMAKSDSPAAVIEIASGRVLTTQKAAPKTPVALSPDERLIASWAEKPPNGAQLTNRLLISSSADGQLLQQIPMPDGGGGLVWSPDSRWLAASGWHTDSVVEVTSGRIVLTFESSYQGQHVGFSSNSERIARAWGERIADTEGCTLSVWDLTTLRRLFARPLTSFPYSVSFAEGDQTVIVGSLGWASREGGDTSEQDDLSLFDANSGDRKRDFRLDSRLGKGPRTKVVGGGSGWFQIGPFFGVSCLVVSPDGERLAAGTLDGSVHLMEIARPEPHQILRGHRTAIAALAFNTKGSRLATLDHTGEIKLWDVGRSEMPSLKHASDFRDGTIGALSADGRSVAWRELQRTRIADLDRHQCLALPEEKNLQLSPDGRWLVADAEIWDTKQGLLARHLGEGNEVQRLLGFSDDGRRAAIGTHSQGSRSGPFSVRVVDTEAWAPIPASGSPMWQGEKWPSDFALNHHGTLVVVDGSNGLVAVCTVAAGDDGKRFLCSFPGAPPYQFGPDDSWVVTGRTNGGFQQVDVRTGTIKRTFHSRLLFFNGGTDGSFEVSRSGRHLSVRKDYSGEPWMEVWNLVTGELLTTVATIVPRECTVFHPDGARMVLPGPDSLLRIWDLAHGKVLMTLPVQARAYGWSRDGTRLTVVRSDLEIEELDGSPWKPGMSNAARIPFRTVTPRRQTSVPGVELVAWLYRTGFGAESSAVATRPPVVYQSDCNGGMSIYQIPERSSGDLVPFVEGAGEPNAIGLVGSGFDIVRRGDYLFAPSRNKGLEVYRLGGPETIPQHVMATGLTNGSWAARLVVSSNIVCVLRGTWGTPSQIQIFDVTAPRSPVQLGAFGSTFYANCGCIIDGRLYLGLLTYDATKGNVTTNLVEGFDISDPTHPVSLGRLALSELAHDLLPAGPNRVIALLGESAALIDTSDPARLKIVGRPLCVPAYTGVVMPWGNRRLLITGAAAVSVAENELKLEGWLPGRGWRHRATSESDLAIIPSGFGAYVFQVRPPP